MQLNKDDAVELFEMRCRGLLSAAFDHSGKSPTAEQWEILRGEREISLRDMGEIGFLTDINISFSFHERHPPKTHEE